MLWIIIVIPLLIFHQKGDRMNISRSVRYTIALNCALSLSMPAHGIGLPKLSMPSSCTINDAAKLAFIAGLIASVSRLYTKKATPKPVLPADDSIQEWMRYIIDEKLIGIIGKGERLNHIDPITGDCSYKKLEARGLLGIIVTNCKDQWLPALLVAVTARKAIEEVLSAYDIIRETFCKNLPEVPKNPLITSND